MRRDKIERETVITFNEEEELAMVWTASPKMMKKLQKLGFKGESRGAKESKFFQVPKKVVAIRKELKKRELSDKELAQRKERMQKLNLSR